MIPSNVYESFTDDFFNFSYMESIPGAMVVVVKMVI